MRRHRALAPFVLLSLASAVSSDEPRRPMRSADLARLPQPRADRVVAYGAAPQQHAELRLPKGNGPHPVVIVIHGGCWQTPWAADHVRALAAALTAEGYATWSLEYRRLGDPGGGWPATLEDVGRGADALRGIAAEHRLDLSRVAALGHSAGGQLALWLAGRRQLPAESALYTADPLKLAGVVSLAGITDLRAGAAGQVCGDAIPSLLGGTPDERADRVAQSSPIELLPLGVPQRLVCGALDALVPNELSLRYQAEGLRAGDAVRLEVVEEAGHFELVDPKGPAWQAVRGAVDTLLAGPASAPRR